MRFGWVVLTMGDRWAETAVAIQSLLEDSVDDEIVLVLNGADPSKVPHLDPRVRVLALGGNVGVPAGRAAGLAELGPHVDYVGFLDDDAQLRSSGVGAAIVELFEASPQTAVVSLRLVDPAGETARRHSPRVGRRGVERPGKVTVFLGGACAIRRHAYDLTAGYWGLLFYSHEELDLSWRLHDAGYRVWYAPDIAVVHPRTPISRHDHGWMQTGRNRVLVARRNLPLPLLVAHTGIWLIAGLLRAPDAGCKRAYWKGWREGWKVSVVRAPIRWSTVRVLSKLGRPPVI